MAQAMCFNCGIILEAIGKPMEELLKDEFPIFCSFECTDEFPTEDNDKRIRFKELEKELKKTGKSKM